MGNSWIGPDEQSMSYGPLLYQLVNDTINVKKVSELAELRQQIMQITKMILLVSNYIARMSSCYKVIPFFVIHCSKKSDAKLQITITTAYLIRIKYPLSGFNYHLFDVNFANFNKIHRTVSEQQLF